MQRTNTDSRGGNAVKGIALDELSADDRLSVWTRRSKYRFSVLDPASRKGVLTGGALGDQTLEAFLSGTISDDRTDFDSKELNTGARAVFFIQSENQARRLITSVITDIAIAKDCEGGENAPTEEGPSQDRLVS